MARLATECAATNLSTKSRGDHDYHSSQIGMIYDCHDAGKNLD